MQDTKASGSGRLGKLLAALALACSLPSALQAADAGKPAAKACAAGTLYLTFDTGSMSQAQLIADTLRRHHIRATFFLANEPTVRQDSSLDPSWSPYWKSLVADGHAFGTHTFDHVYLRSVHAGHVTMRPQFARRPARTWPWTRPASAANCGAVPRPSAA